MVSAVNRHQPAIQGREAVVLLHGLAANRVCMWPLQTYLSKRGFRTFNWGYPSWRGTIQRHAARLQNQLKQVSSLPEVEHIHLVTHSMGGIVARLALQETIVDRIRRVVMLGPPHHGSHAATLLAPVLGSICPALGQLADVDGSFVRSLPAISRYEIGVVAAEHDRVVKMSSTRLPGLSSHVSVPAGHSTMLFRRDVAEYVELFLRNGRFQ